MWPGTPDKPDDEKHSKRRQFLVKQPCLPEQHLIFVWNISRRKTLRLQKVTTGRFEIERNGEVAYLEYSLGGNVLELIHTQVPETLRHMGIASSLAETALHWARARALSVDVICPAVREYIAQHPEYSDLVLH